MTREQDLMRGVHLAIDALHAGDPAKAQRVLQSLVGLPCLCTVCGERFQWPGLLVAHCMQEHGHGECGGS